MKRNGEKQDLRKGREACLRLFSLCCSLLLLLGLTACSKREEGVLAEVRGTPIRQEDLDQALAFYWKVMGGNPDERSVDASEAEKKEQEKKERELEEDLLNQLVWDAIVREDAEDQGLSAESSFRQLQNETVNRLVNEEGLQRQLENLQITEEEYEQSLYQEALNLTHREAYIRDLEIEEEDLEAYYKEQKGKRQLIDYTEAILPNRSLAYDIKMDWEEKGQADDQFGLNEDSFEDTLYRELSNIGMEDERLVDPELFELDEGECGLFSKDDRYHVVFIQQILDDYESVKGRLRERYEEASYLDYMKKRAADFKVTIFKDF